MLRVDVRGLRQGAVETVGELGPADEAFVGLGLSLDGPVSVDGALEARGAGTFLWRGSLGGRLRGECRRCLSGVVTSFAVAVEALFSTDPDLESDPGVYPLAEPVQTIDLTPVVREEVGLAVTPYPLCREDCAGLCPRCGADLNAGPCACTDSAATT